MTIKQAIEALERALKEDAWTTKDSIREVLAAMRSLPGVATPHEAMECVKAVDGFSHAGQAILGFRAGEQFARRKILGE